MKFRFSGIVINEIFLSVRGLVQNLLLTRGEYNTDVIGVLKTIDVLN